MVWVLVQSIIKLGCHLWRLSKKTISVYSSQNLIARRKNISSACTIHHQLIITNGKIRSIKRISKTLKLGVITVISKNRCQNSLVFRREVILNALNSVSSKLSNPIMRKQRNLLAAEILKKTKFILVLGHFSSKNRAGEIGVLIAWVSRITGISCYFNSWPRRKLAWRNPN